VVYLFRPDAIGQIRPEDGEGKPYPLTTKLFGPHCRDNMNWFEDLCQFVSSIGVDSVYFAFMRLDSKVPARYAKRQLEPVVPDEIQRVQIVADLARLASRYGIHVMSCSSDDLINIWPTADEEKAIDATKDLMRSRWAVQPAACISRVKITRMIAERAPNKPLPFLIKDKGQRRSCQCVESIDIGKYRPACSHGCIYCYSTPQNI
jgi:hypothetical protein